MPQTSRANANTHDPVSFAGDSTTSLHFDEGRHTSDTVSFTGCTTDSLTLKLKNSARTFTICKDKDLELELEHTHQTITLTFQTDGGEWPSGATATVRLNSGEEKSLPHTFSNKPTDSKFHVTVTMPSGTGGKLGMITWDPKIRVIPPTRK